MARFQGKRVSFLWAAVLRWAEHEHVQFLLNSGRRTKAEQLALIAEKGIWSLSNPTGAAPYSPFAPHIRRGRLDHAVDINSLDGGETRLEQWVESKGVDWKNTVPGESWHGEISLAGLWKLYRMAKKAMDPYRGLFPDERRWAKEFDELKRAGKNQNRRDVLKRFMLSRRKHIWRQANKSKNGWNRFSRRQRYDALRKRT